MSLTPDYTRWAIRPFLKAVTIPALVIAALFTLMPLFGGAAGFAPIFFASAFVGAWMVIVSFALVIGVPLTLLLVKLRMESAQIYSLVGFLAGIAIWLVLLSSPKSSVGGAIPMGGFPGALCGWLWWRYARRDRAVNGTRG